MSKKSKTDLLRHYVEQALAGTSFELILLEYKKEGPGWVMRAFVDHPEGVDLERCSEANRLITDMLDEHEPIEHAYHVEVSSPGVDRPLVELSHFIRFIGERVYVKLRSSMGGVKKVTGTLRTANEDGIEVEAEADGTPHQIPMDQIAKATLKPILDFK